MNRSVKWAASCLKCHGNLKRFGRTGNGTQRYRCTQCNASFSRAPLVVMIYDTPDGKAIRKPEKLEASKSLFLQGYSTRSVGEIIGLSKTSINRYRKFILGDKVIYCPCGAPSGHPYWCDFRVARSPARQAYYAKCAALSAIRLAQVRPRQLPMLTTWPYVRSFDNDDHALLKYVNDLVPRNLPEHVRSDVCQDVLVDIVSGELTRDGVKSRLPEYVRRAYKFMPSKFGPLSLDGFIYGDEGVTLGERLIG